MFIFRKLAGLNPVVFDTDLGAKCAQAALMMSANRTLNHFPPPSWQFYTADGATAASNSNLFLGFAGPFTIPGYIDDTGANNTAAGHRRWILWSQSQTMGTGDVLGGGSFQAANALWVLPVGPSPPPAVRGGFVAWPFAGSVPNTLVFQRWSFGVPFADFSGATVKVKLGNRNIPVRIIDRASSGVGDNTIVFEPKLTFTGTGSASTVLYQSHLKAPLKPVTYTVTVANVLLNTGAPKTFKYRVKVFPME
ncbi:MAG: CAP domain-containing protein [Chthoniobacterales bacterium]